MAAPKGYDIKQNTLYKDLQALDLTVKSFASRAPAKMGLQISNLLMLNGPPGFGKTEFFRQLCEKHGQEWEDLDYDGNNAGQKIHEKNEAGLVLILDDKDNVFLRPTPLRMLREATQTGVREIVANRTFKKCTLNPATGREDPIIVLCKFCVITNYDLTAMKQFQKAVSIPLSGVKSRSGIIYTCGLGVNASDDDKYHFSCWVVTEVARFLFPNIKVEKINQVLEWWALNMEWVTELTTRVLTQLIVSSVTLKQSEYYRLLNSKLDPARPASWSKTPEEMEKILWTYDPPNAFTPGEYYVAKRPLAWSKKKRQIIARVTPLANIKPLIDDDDEDEDTP